MAEASFPGETVIEIPISHCVKKTCFALDIGELDVIKLQRIRLINCL